MPKTGLPEDFLRDTECSQATADHEWEGAFDDKELWIIRVPREVSGGMGGILH